MPPIGIENISVFGLPPVAFVALAAELGCQHISTGLTSFPFGVHDYPPFSLRDDAALCRELKAALRDTGVVISLGEGCTIREGSNVDDFARDLDLFAELGTQRINSVSMDPDPDRTRDALARLATLVTARGMRFTIEPAPSLTIGDLPTALAEIARIGNPDIHLLIDMMHLVRSGSTAADIAAVDPALIDYVQVSDAPRKPRFASYHEEAMFERMIPGEGELGIAALLAVLPHDRVYALEVPRRAAARAGLGPAERLAPCVAALRQLLASSPEVL